METQKQKKSFLQQKPNSGTFYTTRTNRSK